MATEKRLIDANNLSVMIEETAQGLADCDQQNAAWALRKYAIRDITEAPTVDAVEVVRCKECERSYKSSASSTGYRCKRWGVYDTDCDCNPNGFCSYGERHPNA